MGVYRVVRRRAGPVRNRKMLLLLIALAIASVAFWRVALKILAIASVFLLVYGIMQVAQYLHHIHIQ
jgi:hypothetical protein